MAEILPLPKLSDTMEEGVVASWSKKIGDKVNEGELLCEIETDKATMEYEAPTDGVLIQILMKPGDKAKIGAPMCVFGKAGEVYDPTATASKGHKSADDQKSAAPAPGMGVGPKSSQAAPSQTLPSAPKVDQSPGRVKSSPLARKMAAEAGIDLGKISGSGPLGRVIARDLEQKAVSAAAPSSPPLRISNTQDQVFKNSMMRQTIAKRLLAAKNDAPHFYLTRDVVMDEVVKLRESLSETVKSDKPTPKISVNDIVMMACARALRSHPMVNASWQGEQILSHGAVHVAMAVALPEGLITPVVRHCDQLSLQEISLESKRLAGLAKDNKLKPEDYTIGTFTVSNLGMFGIDSFTAIINPPQAAILAVGATTLRPWVTKKAKIKTRHVMTITLSCDHRVIDGATGARFLQDVVRYLESPSLMLV